MPREVPKWYVMTTLLGCAPGSDRNRRTIYHQSQPVTSFNVRMAEWHQEDTEALSRLCSYLNQMADA